MVLPFQRKRESHVSNREKFPRPGYGSGLVPHIPLLIVRCCYVVVAVTVVVIVVRVRIPEQFVCQTGIFAIFPIKE